MSKEPDQHDIANERTRALSDTLSDTSRARALERQSAAFWTRADTSLALRLPVALAIAQCVPEGRWDRISRWVVGRGAIGGTSIAPTTARLKRYLEPAMIGRPLEDLACDVLVQQRLLQLRTLKSLILDRWQPKISLVGRERVEPFEKAGRGVIFWHLPMVGATLVGKMALARHGLPHYQLSRYGHPYTQSRIGCRILNPVRTIPENRHLAGRVVIERGQSAGDAMRRLSAVLADGGFVSIAVGANARQTRAVPFLKGEITVAEGPLRFAARCEAPIMPVITVEEPDGFKAMIEPPVETVDELSALFQAWVLRAPEQALWTFDIFRDRRGTHGRAAS